MPQMSPMYWTMMLLMMTIMYMQINSMIFFNQTNMEKKKKMKLNKNSNWKW